MEFKTDQSSTDKEEKAAVVSGIETSSSITVPVQEHEYINSYRIQREIAAGAIGIVYAAVHVATNQLVALKVTNKIDAAYRTVESPYRELRVWKRIMQMGNHANLVPLLRYGESKDDIWVSTPLCSGGDLYHCIKSRYSETSHGLEPTQTRSWFAQLVSAVNYLHTNGIYHLDISAENVFISDDRKSVVLGDYGVAFDQDERKSCGGSVPPKPYGKGTYMSPEVATKTHSPGPAADIWSLGVLLYAMTTGVMLYRHPGDVFWQLLLRSDIGLCKMLDTWNIRRYFSADALDLVQKMLVLEPCRISIADVMSHPYVSGCPLSDKGKLP